MYNFITLGSDCSPASALRNLDLRTAALPFDWVISNIQSLNQCFKTNFQYYHTGLQLNSTKTRLIDAYGFEFPHDYPFTDMSNISDIGEGVFGEEKGKTITDNWFTYYDTVREKYLRRIERFMAIVRDPTPLIVLCRYHTSEITSIQLMFRYYFNKENVYFVNSSPEAFMNDHVINCYTERNGAWNEAALWKEGITIAVSLILSAESKATESQE